MSNAPPFRLPGTHFAGVLVSLLTGSAGLVVIAPALAAAEFLDPRVLAVTHIFTLGVIVSAVFGALYQFYPMSLGAAARSTSVGVAGAWLLHLGTILLVAGLWFWIPVLQAAGWCAIFLAVGCVSWNLLPHRRRMTQGRRTAEYVSTAHAMLGLAMLIAAARIGAALGWWETERLGSIAAHFHLGAFGLAGLTLVGVGARMLPMFLVSGPAPERPLRWINPAATVGLLLLASGLLFGFAPAVWAGASLGLAATAAFVRMVAGFVSRRLVRRLEPAFGHVIVAFVMLLAALVVGVGMLVARGFTARGWTLYAELVLLGWLVILISGVLYRLFPFLIWLHFYARLGSTRVAAELVHRGAAWAALALLAGGVVMLAAGTALASAALARTGAIGFLFGSMVVVAQYPRMFAGGLRRPPAG